MKVSKFFNSSQQKKIFYAIRSAEKKTSGEIVIHIENHCKEDVLQRSKVVFDELNMSETEHKNGVLIYLAVIDKKFAIIGDEGIDKVTPDDFWDSIRDILQVYFKNNDFTNGLIEAVNMIGEKLEEYFPYQSNDINELADKISFYDN